MRKALTEGFVRNVFVLLGGTAFAHAITILTLPMLTRLYSPAEFGMSAVFVALLGIVSVASAWRYEIALPLPESDAHAANLLIVALCCVVITTVAISVLVILFAHEIAHLTNSESLEAYLWLLPAGVALTSASEVFRFWAIRRKAFARVARTRVEQAVGGITTQLGFGWTGGGALGLIVGQVVNNGLGFFSLARQAHREDRELLREISLTTMTMVAREHDRFPKFSTGEALANVAAVQLPLILIASLATSAEVGYLMLGMRLMQAPIGLIGSSISQVFFTSAVEQHRLHQLNELTARSISNLAKIGIGPLAFAGIVAPNLFGFVFGREWQRAGELVSWMTPWFVFQFLSSPVSMVLQITSNQRMALVLQLTGFILRVSSVLIFAYLGYDLLCEGYAISGWVFYLAYLFIICKVASVPLLRLVAELAPAIPFISSWIVVGIGVRWLL